MLWRHRKAEAALPVDVGGCICCSNNLPLPYYINFIILKLTEILPGYKTGTPIIFSNILTYNTRIFNQNNNRYIQVFKRLNNKKMI
jgi:hypothetical protein